MARRDMWRLTAGHVVVHIHMRWLTGICGRSQGDVVAKRDKKWLTERYDDSQGNVVARGNV